MHPPELRLCSAHSKRTGDPCRARVKPGQRVCRMHGRDAGRPPIHGRYSKLPTRIHDAYERATSDPKLLDLADGIALMDSLLVERIERLSLGDSARWRRDLSQAVTEYREADPDLQFRALTKVFDLIESGANASQAEDEVFAMREKVSARVEELWRIRLARGSVVNARDLAKLFTLQLVTIRDVLTAEGVGSPVQMKLLRALMAQAAGSDAAPSDFRSELRASAIEVAGSRA